jgi:hypothetical protein
MQVVSAKFAYCADTKARPGLGVDNQPPFFLTTLQARCLRLVVVRVDLD